MRRPRLKAPAFLPVARHHGVSRVADRGFVFGETASSAKHLVNLLDGIKRRIWGYRQ